MKLTDWRWGLLLWVALPPRLAAQAPVELLPALRRDVAARGLLLWSRASLPGWSRFQGVPRLGTATAAETSSGVTYLIQCQGDRLRWAVLTTFSPAESWVRPDVPRDSILGPPSLRHEHTHFHISELLARWIRRGFDELRQVCPGGEERAHALFQRLAAEGAALQTRYDDETRHGLRRDAERRWEAEILARLDELRRYTVPDPAIPVEPIPRSGP